MGLSGPTGPPAAAFRAATTRSAALAFPCAQLESNQRHRFKRPELIPSATSAVPRADMYTVAARGGCYYSKTATLNRPRPIGLEPRLHKGLAQCRGGVLARQHSLPGREIPGLESWTAPVSRRLGPRCVEVQRGSWSSDPAMVPGISGSIAGVLTHPDGAPRRGLAPGLLLDDHSMCNAP